jgi:ribosomal protein L32
MEVKMRFGEVDYHRPIKCEKCGGIMVFKGVGEYQCEDCKFVAYDDYGKTRLYIEKHPGATASEVEMATGVSQKAIRQMLKENRLQIAQDSASFLRCEICGTNIRGGRLCAKCEMEYHRRLEDEQRAEKKKNKSMEGHGKAASEAKGEKRFHRDY